MSYWICSTRTNGVNQVFRQSSSSYSAWLSISRSFATVSMRSMDRNETEYASWSSEQLVARVTALEEQLRQANARSGKLKVPLS